MSTTAQYASVPVFGAGIVSAADTSMTAPTAVTTLVTAGASGIRIDYVNIVALGTTAAGIINLFVFDGTTYHIWQQIPIQVATQSATQPGYQTSISSNNNANVMPLILPTGYSLRCTTTVAQTGIKVAAYGGNF